MVNSDPKRTPSFTMFGDPDFFFQIGNVCKGPSTGSGRAASASTPASRGTTATSQDEIGNTWFGMVGPGVDRNGIDSKTWTDHVDLRPTINALLGLQDNYTDDGRVVTQILDERGHPAAGSTTGHSPAELGDVLQADQRAVRAVRERHARRVDRSAEDERRAEVRLDRDVDRRT